MVPPEEEIATIIAANRLQLPAIPMLASSPMEEGVNLVLPIAGNYVNQQDLISPIEAGIMLYQVTFYDMKIGKKLFHARIFIRAQWCPAVTVP